MTDREVSTATAARIAGAGVDEFEAGLRGRVLRPGDEVYDEARRLYRSTEQFVQHTGREPTDDELSRVVGLPRARVQELRAVFVDTVSADQPLYDDGDETLVARIATLDDEPAESVLDRGRLKLSIESLLGALPPLHSRVIRLRYGIGTSSELSLPLLAQSLGLSGQRVRDIEREALDELRARSSQWRDFFAD